MSWWVVFYTQNLCEIFSKWGYLEHTMTLAENNIQFQQLPRAVCAMFNTFFAPWRRRRLPKSMHTWFPFQLAQSCCLVDSTRIQNKSQRRLLCWGTMKTYNFHLSWNEWRKKTRKWNRKIFLQTAAKKYSKKTEREYTFRLKIFLLLNVNIFFRVCLCSFCTYVYWRNINSSSLSRVSPHFV